MINPDFDGIPLELRGWKHWALVRHERGRNVPYRLNGRHARCDAFWSWSRFDHVVDVYQLHRGLADEYHTIAFALNEIFEIVLVDIDDCIDEHGALAPFAEDIVSALNSYTEISLSGTGLHVLARGELPPHGRKVGPVEMYEHLRFVALTGVPLAGVPLPISERRAELLEIHERFIGAPQRVGSSLHSVPSFASANRQVTTDDETLLVHAFAAANHEKFERLFLNGDAGEYGGDLSRADLALCRLLTYRAGDNPQRIAALFRRSALYRLRPDREKYDRRHFADGSTYLEHTIAMAIASVRGAA